MYDSLLAQIEREVLGWPGVSKETGGGGRGRNGFWVRRPPSSDSAAGISGMSTTTKAVWPTSRFPRRFGKS